MLLCEYIGQDNKNFSIGNKYKLIKLEDNSRENIFRTWFLNNEDKLQYVSYNNIEEFNLDWKIGE